jgi:activator of HSP90 ATPase
MSSTILNRREFSVRMASLFPALSIGGIALGADSAVSESAATEEISHSAEAIHQEVVFKASRKRVYEALTDAKQFTKITELSPVKNAPPAEISPNVGGTFSCFGGVILGRHVELVSNERIVQAWRVSYWNPGIYSIAKFELKEEGDGTRIVFDHTGFPKGAAETLASGWKEHYWEPLEKYLAG